MLLVGEADKERLNIQNRICDPYTRRFRQENLPDLTGKTILDVGCGTGILSCYWANEVGPTGKVIALDISREQLNIARENADKLGMRNIEFLESNIDYLNSLTEKFDLIYCRYILMHLKDQERALKMMLNQMQPGGYLFCEETMGYDTFFADPDSPAFQAWKQLILKLPHINDTDFYVGKRLNSLFFNMGLQSIKSEICQPMIHDERDKGYFYLGFTTIFKKLFINKGFNNLAEIDQIIENLKSEILLKPWCAGAVQYMQIVGQKPKIQPL